MRKPSGADPKKRKGLIIVNYDIPELETKLRSTMHSLDPASAINLWI